MIKETSTLTRDDKRWLLILIVALTMIVAAAGCKKDDDYPSMFLEITATDCTYTKSGEVITFRYVANHPGNVPYKRGTFKVTCKRSNIEELIKHPHYPNEMFKYIRVDTAWFVSYGDAYLAK